MEQLQRIDKSEAAALTGVALATLRKHIYGQQCSSLLKDFPEPCHRGRRLLWVKQDILDWLASQRTFVRPLPQAIEIPIEPLVKRPRGRPSKAALLARQQAPSIVNRGKK